MTERSSNFRALNDFGLEEIDAEASISRLMLQRLANIEDSKSPGPSTPGGRAALATSVVAHAVIELEAQILELRRLSAQKE